MTQPIAFVTDWKASRFDDLELVTVESLDPDSDAVLATSTNVTALVGRETGGELPIADGGTAGATKRDITLVVEEMSFTVKTRDRVTRDDGTKWRVGPRVEAGGFDGELAICIDCVEER